MPDQTQQQNQGGAPEHAHPNRKAMAILAYLGILIAFPFFMAKNDPFVKFHVKQGLLLFIAWIIVSVLLGGALTWTLGPILQLINLAIAVLAIIGIVNVVHNEQKELPLVGHLATKYFTF